MPMSFAPSVPDWAVDEVKLFLTTTFAGCPEARKLDMAVEALVMHNVDMPRVQLLITGNGGNAKSARTPLRGNVRGPMHKEMSALAFQKPEEFRKQGCQFAHAKLIAVQECSPGVPLEEDVWKCFVAGGFLACRPLFGKTTAYYHWLKCAKFWECNQVFWKIHGSPQNV
eukprot:3943454-Pyramimonas_sp.AAC.1